MLLPRVVISMLSFGLIVVGASGVSGQTTSTGSELAPGLIRGQAYPNKTIRIVTGNIGGGNDFISRLVAQAISGPLGQSVIVDNRDGAITPGLTVAKATPDGYTLLLFGITFYYDPLMRTNPSYDPIKDFSPITMISKEGTLLVVTTSLPVNSVKELIALAKAKPGELNFASNGVGGTAHIAGELFKSLAGIDIVHIPFASGSQEIADLIGGRVHLQFKGSATTLPLVKAGKLKLLAVTTAEPFAPLPGVPPVAATVPGYELVSISGVYAPAKTPDAIIRRLNQEIVRILGQADVKEKLTGAGQQIVGSSPEELGAWLKTDTARVGKVIKDANIPAR